VRAALSLDELAVVSRAVVAAVGVAFASPRAATEQSDCWAPLRELRASRGGVRSPLCAEVGRPRTYFAHKDEGLAEEAACPRGHGAAAAACLTPGPGDPRGGRSRARQGAGGSVLRRKAPGLRGARVTPRRAPGGLAGPTEGAPGRKGLRGDREPALLPCSLLPPRPGRMRCLPGARRADARCSAPARLGCPTRSAARRQRRGRRALPPLERWW
jgi:hypothetical protein